MRTACRRELMFQNAHRAQARAQFCRPKMMLMTSKVSTALRREHHSQSKWAPCAGERPKSAPAKRRRCSRCGGAHPTCLNWDPLDVRGAHCQRRFCNRHAFGFGRALVWRNGVRRHAATQFARIKNVETLRTNGDEGPKCCTGHSCEWADFEQAWEFY